MDDAFTQLFAHKEPGPRFKPSEVASIIAEPGMSPEAVAHEVRALLRANLIMSRERVGSGTVKPQSLLSLSDVGTAKVFAILKWDYGITDPQILSFVSAGLYGWQDGDRTPKADRFPHPIFNAIRDATLDKDWVFQLNVFRDASTGARSYRTALFDLDARSARRDAETAMPRGSIMLNLKPHLLQIAAAGERKLKAN